ncbi:MAG: glutamate-5-semialdehyde dehydrogenase [Myxococcales bacterium]
MTIVLEQAQRARAAARRLAKLERAEKDRVLFALADRLRKSVDRIAPANAKDIEKAKASGLSAAMIDRLTMGAKAIESTAAGVEYIAGLEDPVGSRREMVRRPNGLLIGRQRIPLGTIGMIYESRPNVTIDSAALCLKSGNAVLLRGGKEALETNRMLGEIVAETLTEAGVSRDAVQIVSAESRDSISELISLSGWVDLVIPRGGEGLIRYVTEHARVPVIQHFKGVCHLFLDFGCDTEMAIRLAMNGKTQRPGVCNALECLLVHAGAAPTVLPAVAKALLEAGVELRGCRTTCKLVPAAKPATDADWGMEFLDKILAIRVVDDIDQALEHVARYGSNHTEAICTSNYDHANRWVREVDASCVTVNASTRFNDGGQLGLGAEIGISTSKLHAYGPMGLESLTSEKWVVFGEGQVRQG